MNIINFEKKFICKSYLTIGILGNSYKLNIKYSSNDLIELIKKDLEFELILPKKSSYLQSFYNLIIFNINW